MGKSSIPGCPVNGRKVDEQIVRIIAGVVVVLATPALFLDCVELTVILWIDFALRAFGLVSYSALRLLAEQIAAVLNLPRQPVDEAPKRFAATLGFVVISVILLVQILQLSLVVQLTLGSTLIVFALLESLLAFCVGCMLYRSVSMLWRKVSPIDDQR